MTENVKAGGDLLPPYGRVQAHTDILGEIPGMPGGDLLPHGGLQAHTDILFGMPPEIPMKAESERQRRRQSFPMVPCESYGFGRDITVSERSKRNQGEPASVVWRSTGHTDSPLSDSPPGIAERFRIQDAGCPSVRLDDSRDSEYLKDTERSRLFRRLRI